MLVLAIKYISVAGFASERTSVQTPNSFFYPFLYSRVLRMQPPTARIIHGWTPIYAVARKKTPRSYFDRSLPTRNSPIADKPRDAFVQYTTAFLTLH